MVWSEHGGPPVKEPTRKGFGSRLIERSIRTELQGSVQPVFLPAGLRVAIEVPLPRMQPSWEIVAEAGATRGQDAA
jgi:two-component sensor histidine kinase